MVKISKYSITIIPAFLFCLLILTSCKERYENLDLTREDYNGKALRLDGYYYHQSAPKFTSIIFLYRNGITYSFGVGELDFNKVDDFINKIPPLSREARTAWGIFQVSGDDLNIETWDIVSGGKIPTNIRGHKILNDTTIRGNQSDMITYKFRHFSPKPDSTNNFVK